ncbi:MAG: hypothetical protein NXI13_02455 [Proteobacteria bacterium]|nr:hypothetical protein [Pseudomonadota bacterium]
MQTYLMPITLEEAILLAFEMLTILVTVATVITALTPSRWDNRMLDRVFQFMNLIAGNVGQNRNADDR